MNKLASTITALVASIATVISSEAQQIDLKKLSPQKREVVEVLNVIETGNTKALKYIDAKNYKQHNTEVEDGLLGFRKALKALKGTGKNKVVRVFQDGDYVFAQSEGDFFGPVVAFDIFRYKDGKIVEHWDNSQAKPADKNPSGHSMTDGTLEITDLERTESNKKLVQNFVEDILRDGKMERLTNYFDGDNYIQHNPAIGDGLSGLGVALEAMAKQGVVMKYDRIHKVLGEGNFVLVVSEGSLGGKHTSFYDLFRVKDGKIVEHWDTIETIQSLEDHKNSNGKFGF